MKIKSRLRLNTIISLGTVILILLSLVWSWRQIFLADRKMAMVDGMRKIAFERILFRDEYLIFQEERSGKQWLAKTEDLRNLLAVAETYFDHKDDSALLQDARKNFDATVSGFSGIIESRADKDSGVKANAGFSEAELRQISQVFLKAYSLTDNINRLHESTQSKTKNVQNSGAFIVVSFIFIGIIAIIINSTIIRRTLAKRITALGKGVEILGSGNLDYRIAVEGDDELSALALASNEMASELKKSYASVDSLEKQIAERKRAEEALGYSEIKYRRLFEATKDGILILDAETGMVVEVNPILTEMLGYSHETFLGKKIWELGFFKDIVANQDNFAELQLKEYLRYDDLPLETANGRRIEVEFISNVYLVNQQKVIQCNIRDISERKLAADKLKESLADLQRSNKELEQFAYVASHDLQEPLRMVSSYTQLLAERYQDKLDDKANLFIRYAVDGAVRMQLLINDLLTFSRIGSKGKALEPVDCHAVLGQAVYNLKMNIEEAKAIITNDELPEVRADASQLVQLFQNLIGNALKFRGEEYPQVHISAQDEGADWLFSVRDNGIGIDPQFSDKVFVIFQRLHTREEYQGSGIGLAICKKIVERHGGRIWFESEPGKGATFYFTIQK